MSRPLFMFRPNLRNAEHRKAWEVLQNVPEGQKSAFLVQAILETVQKEDLEAILRRVLREELKSSSSHPPPGAAGRTEIFHHFALRDAVCRRLNLFEPAWI